MVTSSAGIKPGEPGEPLDAGAVPRRCGRTDAGGAIGREALATAATVASGASIEAGESGEAFHREPLDAVPCRAP
jgi:hypothetical protein